MAYRKIHRRTKLKRRVGFEFCVPLRTFAEDNHLSVYAVRYRIATYRLIGYWFRKKWWILPPEYYEQLGLYPKGFEPAESPSQTRT